jgi:hypothetical protein
MSYARKPEFDRPDAESVQRSRRNMVWLVPLVAIQQGVTIFRTGADLATQVIGVLAWGSVSVLLMWWLFGLPARWLSERDHAVLNDEWSKAVSGDAARWGIATATFVGFALMLVRLWWRVDAGVAIYALVNSMLIVAVARYHWLNRGESDEDE